MMNNMKRFRCRCSGFFYFSLTFLIIFFPAALFKLCYMPHTGHQTPSSTSDYELAADVGNEKAAAGGKLMKKVIRLRSGRVRRQLTSGPGSYPPRCVSKCGRCYPCKPVHVSVRPGRPVTAEYYPEAWRCKCRNRLYMP